MSKIMDFSEKIPDMSEFISKINFKREDILSLKNEIISRIKLKSKK